MFRLYLGYAFASTDTNYCTWHSFKLLFRRVTGRSRLGLLHWVAFRMSHIGSVVFTVMRFPICVVAISAISGVAISGVESRKFKAGSWNQRFERNVRVA